VVDPRRPRENPGTVSDATPPSPFYRVSVKALVFDRDGRLLVVQEPDGLWEVPGGGWEHGESFEECLARELAEEIMALRWVTRGQFDDLSMRDGDDTVRAHIQSHWPD
jgi:ADP-ribose pyrophosphatase YjhB (NUDIX family)